MGPQCGFLRYDKPFIVAAAHPGPKDAGVMTPRLNSGDEALTRGQSHRLSDVTGANALLFQILLVIILGSIKRSCGQDLGDDGTLENALFFEKGFGVAGGCFLPGIMEENRGAILRA